MHIFHKLTHYEASPRLRPIDKQCRLRNLFSVCFCCIASSAGIAKGSIYQYFDNKREIYIYCARWGLDYFMKELDKRMDFSLTDIFDYFRNSVPRLEVIEEERELMLFMQNIAKEPGLIGDSMKEMLRISDEYVKNYIRVGQSKGTVRRDIDDELLKVFVYKESELSFHE